MLGSVGVEFWFYGFRGNVRVCLVCLVSGVSFVVVVVVVCYLLLLFVICCYCFCGEIYVGTVVFSPVHNKLLRMRIIR